MPVRLEPPAHRHAAPSAPWPFLDLDDEVDPIRIVDPYSHLPLSTQACEHRQTPQQEVCWCKYPQSLYPNWTVRQQRKSGILNVVKTRKGVCVIRYLDVRMDGRFVDAGVREVSGETLDRHWEAIQRGRPEDVRLRVVFVDDCSGPVLQMLGTRYNIEPFFFSSTIGWIPSHFQSNLAPHESDHLTVIFTFIRPVHNESVSSDTSNPGLIIDTQAPLPLRSNNTLLIPDRLALHIIRSRTSNTIISLHPTPEHRATTAETLHSRVHLTGRSVYWNNIFRESDDPTLVFLSFLWYAVYAWDEAMERLYAHVCFLESQVMITNDIAMTHELHVIRAHLLHYEALLVDFGKAVRFVRDTANPALQARAGASARTSQSESPSPREEEDTPDDSGSHRDQEEAQHQEQDQEKAKRHRRLTEEHMHRECENLLSEIERLEKGRNMQEKRLKNVMDLGFSSINIEDSRQTRTLTEAAVRDSAAMKQIAYLTMVFLPAGFVAAVFGMNVTELTPGTKGTLAHYLAAALPLTVMTVWIVGAYQIRVEEEIAGEGAGAGAAGKYMLAGTGAEDADADADGYKFGVEAPRGSTRSDGKEKEKGKEGLKDMKKEGGMQGRRWRKLDVWERVVWPVLLVRTFLGRRRRSFIQKEGAGGG